MRYGHDVAGIRIEKDVYAPHFGTVEDIKTNYMVGMDGTILWEGEDPKALARELKAAADRLISISLFLSRIGVPRPKGLERGDK